MRTQKQRILNQAPSMKKNETLLNINDAQMVLYECKIKYQFYVWGRGTGKSAGIGLKHYNRLLNLPRGKVFLISSTYKQILNNCLAPMIKLWTSLGLEEYDFKTKRGHYVVGRKPPPHFLKPYAPPREYEHIITFWNGYTIEMMSMDRPSPNRGGSFDGGDADEIALINKEHLMLNMMPTIRGNTDIYGEKNPYHLRFSGYTSMPWLSSGQWVLDFELKAKEDKDFFYHEATAVCNLRALGRSWIEDQRKFLSPEIFEIEIMNNRKKKAEGQFYHKFSDEKHVYTPAITYVDDPGGRGILVDRYTDHNPDQLIDISWDFGGWFTGALLFQQKHSKMDSSRVIEQMIDSFYVTKGGSAIDVVDQIIDKYSNHKYRCVRIWGEPRGHQQTAYPKTLYEDVETRFRAHKWTVEIRVQNNQAHTHDLRYTFINDILAETKALPRLRCNSETCKAPILAIQFAEKTYDLKKDKKNEKDRTFDQEKATHFTDALDYFFMQKHYKSNVGGGMGAWF